MFINLFLDESVYSQNYRKKCIKVLKQEMLTLIKRYGKIMEDCLNNIEMIFSHFYLFIY